VFVYQCCHRHKWRGDAVQVFCPACHEGAVNKYEITPQPDRASLIEAVVMIAVAVVAVVLVALAAAAAVLAVV
jgi:hypothetical protein